MKTSTGISNLTKALLLAQRKMGAAVKGAKNPFFRSNYADLPTVMEVVKEPLNEAGILILQPAMNIDGKNFIETVLIHSETGETLISETEVICAKPNDPQAFGAAQTYARRFGLQSMLFIPAEDDDGNIASGKTTPAKTYSTPVSNKVTEVKVETASATSVAAPTSIAPLAGKTSSFRKSNKSVETPVVNTEVSSTEVVWK